MNKRGSVCLKLHFPIGLRRILAAIGTDWHRNDAMVCTLGKWKSSFRSLRSQIRFGLTTDLIPVLILGSIGIGKRCFESQNISTNSNPFAGGLLLSRESSKVSFGLPEGFSVTAENGSSKVCFELLKTFRVTPENLAAGLPLRSRATCSNLWCNWSILCTLCRTILSCCIA